MKSNKIAVVLLGLPGLTFAEVCADIEEDEARLACYDAQSNGSAAAPAELEPPAPSSQIAEESVSPERPKDAETAVEAGSSEKFGIRESDDDPKEYVRLDNGQVWREVTDSRMRFKEGRKVTITEGIMSSYDLRMEGYNKVVKVKRVR
jgi:hypothetical protein